MTLSLSPSRNAQPFKPTLHPINIFKMPPLPNCTLHHQLVHAETKQQGNAWLIGDKPRYGANAI